MTRIIKLCLLSLLIFNITFSLLWSQDLADRWKDQINNTWPDNLTTEQKLDLFEKIWKSIDEDFAEFIGLKIDWNKVKIDYRTEIESGVSRGRFVGIMNHLALLLQESHTFFSDSLVNWGTIPKPDIPLSYVGGWGDNSHFGAGLTPMPDSTLLVYQVVPDHPLNLEVGDMIIGYEGIPWKKLYKEIMNCELPVGKFGNGLFEWGTNDEAFAHSWLMSAGLNWHLFDSIDILKYGTTDTLHLPTALLLNQKMEIFATEQMPISGIPFPNIENNEYLSWGVIRGTQIGYINIWSWSSRKESDLAEHFNQAMDELTNRKDIIGIIIDQRFNTGGYASIFYLGIGKIFLNASVFIGQFRRSDPSNHLELKGGYISGGVSWQDLVPIYDKPIAILTGPGAISAADFFVRILKFYPKARTFGKSTSSAFGSPTWIDTNSEGWGCKYSTANFAFLDSMMFDVTQNDVELLARTVLDVDEKVWLTSEDVRNGIDTIVESAISWIQSQATFVDKKRITPDILNFELKQNFPNPFNASTIISYELFNGGEVELSIYNLLGQKITTLYKGFQDPGAYQITFNAESLAAGIYIYQINLDDQFQRRKFLLLK